MLRWSPLALVLFAASGPAGAQDAAPPASTATVYTEAPVPVVPAPKDAPGVNGTNGRAPNGKSDLRGLMWRMDKYVKGQRVMALGYGDFREDIAWSDEAFNKAPDLIAKLQMIGAKQSSKTKDIIPFRVGNAFVLAGETRLDASTDFSATGADDASSRGLLLDSALTALTPEQVKGLASDEGVAVASLPDAARDALARAFRPPLGIVKTKLVTWKDDNGMPHSGQGSDLQETLTEPLDWSRMRVRARLHTMGATVSVKANSPDGPNDYPVTLGEERVDRAFFDIAQPSNNGNWNNRSLDLPIYADVPNTFKPSDLEGRRLAPLPIGMVGVQTVEDVVARLSKALGLKMRVIRPFKDQPFYLGSPSITVGEVADGLRLALEGAWRKLGDTYILTWDRMGIRAVQERIRETSVDVGKIVRKKRDAVDNSTGWLAIADGLPFESSDPLALTDVQRKKMFGEDAKPDEEDAGRHVTFTEMTSEQQDYIRKAAENTTLDTPNFGNSNVDASRPFNPHDIESSYLMDNMAVEVQLQVQGHGWVASASDWDNQGINRWTIEKAKRNLAKESGDKKPPPTQPIPPEIMEMMKHPQPVEWPSPTRALMAPAMGAARLNALAGEMKRHGLNTLFYPVLTGGYATFPTASFPLHPSLREADGWAAAVAAMKPAGIKVVGYLNTLAWQEAGQNAHWLNKRPDLLDVDVLGRTRLDWLSDHPAAAANPLSSITVRGNFVRPTEPMVTLKLQELLADFEKQPGAAGIAFTDWSPGRNDGSENVPGFGMTVPPDLGFAVMDRIATLNRTGQDPVDVITSEAYVPQSLMEDYWSHRGDEDPAAVKEPHRAVVDELIRRAKKDRPDWKTYLFDDGLTMNGRDDAGKAKDDPAVKPDVTIASLFASGGPNGTQSFVLPITTKNLFASMMDSGDVSESDMGTMPPEMRTLPTLALFSMAFMSVPHPKDTAPPVVVFDFRSAPELITSSMQWIKPPGPKPPAAKAPVKK